MASRSFRGRRIIDDSSSDSNGNGGSSDDEFPDLKNLQNPKSLKTATAKNVGKPIAQTEQTPAKSVRRRKLGVINDNPLLRPFGNTSSATPFKKNEAPVKKKSTTPQRIELRTRKTRPVITSLEIDDSSEAESIQEETIIEDFSGSDFDASQTSDEDGDDDDSTFGDVPQRSPSKRKGLSNGVEGGSMHRERKRSPSPSAQLLAEAMEAETRDDIRKSKGRSRACIDTETFKKEAEETRGASTDDLGDRLLKLKVLVSSPRKLSTGLQY